MEQYSATHGLDYEYTVLFLRQPQLSRSAELLALLGQVGKCILNALLHIVVYPLIIDMKSQGVALNQETPATIIFGAIAVLQHVLLAVVN